MTRIQTTHGQDRRLEPDVDLVFIEVFSAIKRLVLAHSICTEQEVEEFLGTHLDSAIDYLAADIIQSITAQWKDVVTEIRLSCRTAVPHQG